MADIDASPVLWLTTLRPDGSPHTTPVWFVFDGDRFWVATAERNTKVRNLRRDPRASMAVEGTGAGHPRVAEGAANVHDDPRARPEVLARLRMKYPGWDPADAAVDGPRVLVEIVVGRWLLS